MFFLSMQLTTRMHIFLRDVDATRKVGYALCTHAETNDVRTYSWDLFSAFHATTRTHAARTRTHFDTRSHTHAVIPCTTTSRICSQKSNTTAATSFFLCDRSPFDNPPLFGVECRHQTHNTDVFFRVVRGWMSSVEVTQGVVASSLRWGWTALWRPVRSSQKYDEQAWWQII